MTMMHQFHKKNGDDAYKKDGELVVGGIDSIGANYSETVSNSHFWHSLTIPPSDYQNAVFHYTLAIETARSELAMMKDSSLKHPLACLYSNRAAASSMLRHYNEACNDCDSAIHVDPTYDKAYLRKAQLQVMNGMLSDALETLQKVLDLDPTHKRALEEYKCICAIQKHYDQAICFFQQQEQEQSNDEPTSQAPEKIAQVARDIDLILEKCVAWKEARVLQARALWAMGHVEESFEATQKLVAQENMTENAQLHMLRAEIFTKMGKSEDAIVNLRTVLAHDRDYPPAVKLYAKLKEFLEIKAVADRHYKARRYDDALEQYGVAMKYCPSPAYKAKLYFNRACTHASLGRHDMAIQDCSESIRLNDEYIKAYMRRAASLRMMVTEKERWYECAIQDYQVARTLCKNKQQSREIYRKLKDTKRELFELQQYEAKMREKMLRRHSLSAPMVVTPESSPAGWARKSAPIFRSIRTIDGETLSITKSRSRASSASSMTAMEWQ